MNPAKIVRVIIIPSCIRCAADIHIAADISQHQTIFFIAVRMILLVAEKELISKSAFSLILAPKGNE